MVRNLFLKFDRMSRIILQFNLGLGQPMGKTVHTLRKTTKALLQFVYSGLPLIPTLHSR
jgi:hypothetical protein